MGMNDPTDRKHGEVFDQMLPLFCSEGNGAGHIIANLRCSQNGPLILLSFVGL